MTRAERLAEVAAKYKRLDASFDGTSFDEVADALHVIKRDAYTDVSFLLGEVERLERVLKFIKLTVDHTALKDEAE